jgi:cell division protein DivIC
MIQTIKSALHGKDTGQRRRMRLYVVVMSIFLLWALVTMVRQQWTLYQTHQQMKKVQAQLAEVKKQNQVYKDELKKLGDKEYIEQILRSQLYMTKNGEQLFLEGQ